MEKLSAVVANISNSVTAMTEAPNTSSHGSTNDVLTTNSQLPALAARENPLTDAQLTQIASAVLLKLPVISSMKKPVYEKKMMRNEDGNDYLIDQMVSYENQLILSLDLKQNITPSFIKSALRHSPPSASITHLTRLAVHKRMGSTDADRSLLLHDFAVALAEFSEFVVFLACKTCWENSESGFYPTIKVLRDICAQIDGTMNRALLAPPEPKTEQRRVREEDTTRGQDTRRKICDEILALGGEDEFGGIQSNYQLESVLRHRRRTQHQQGDRK